MKSPMRGEFLDEMLFRARRALEGLEKSARPDDIPRKKLLQTIVPQVEKLREEWLIWQQ